LVDKLHHQVRFKKLREIRNQ